MIDRTISKLMVISSFVFVVAASACSPASLPIIVSTSTSTPTGTAKEAPAVAPMQTPAAHSRSNPGANKNPTAALPANLSSLGLEGGIVAANNGTELSLRLGKGTQQLSVSTNTLVAVPGKKTAQLSDISVGDRVIADVGTGDTSAPARFILDIPQGYTTDNVVAGAVLSRDKTGIQVRAKGGNELVTPDTSTVIIDMTGDQAKVGAPTDIRRGTGVLVIGQSTNSGLTAQVVVVVDRNTLQGRRSSPGGTPTSTP